MTHTALKEQYGGSVDVTLSTTTPYQCSHDSRHGCRRFYILRPTVVGAIARLPNADYQTIGANPSITIINRGTQTLTVQTASGTLVGVLPANIGAEFYCLFNAEALNAAANVTWTYLPMVNTTVGASLNTNRIPFSITYTASSTTPTFLDLDIGKTFGYRRADGPVALDVTIAANVVLGSNSVNSYAFYTGSYPSGSTLTLTLQPGAYISGAGGTGGTGQLVSGTGMTQGGNGGGALAIYVNTTLINNGRIQGGGGGGGGAARRTVSSITYPGGSGGGGAGAVAGVGGPQVGSPPDPSTAGQVGTLLLGGLGGASSPTSAFGGIGGTPGVAGNVGQSGVVAGASGGSGGPAIGLRSGFTITTITAGTQLGGTVTL